MSDKTFREDNYLPCRRYDGYEIDDNGFSTFVDPENNEFYFSYLEDGKVILRSEGYANAPGRDNGIASVKKNMENESMYTARMLPDGRWVLSLKAANHQEIARSCPVTAEHEALALLPSARKKAREEARLAAEAEAAKALALSATPVPSEDRRDDDYLTCRNYEGHERLSDHNDFSTFEHGGEYFFAMLDTDGNVRLRSERYTSIAARDNGIQSVIKNREIKARFSIEEQRGIFYVILKAGNHQEIARSCPYRTEAEADAFINPLIVAAAAPKPQRKEDDYLACKMYDGHERSATNPDFSTFSHEGEFYFAMLDSDGKVRLRSEGYKSEAARDNGIASVTKNRENKDRFSIEEKMKYFFVVLKAGNHQEIGRSCPYGSHAEADAFINPPVVVAAAPKPQRKDDDYLACKMYDGHERSTDNPDFSIFSHEGEFYFAMLDSDGKVRLRSEGYKSEAARDNGIASVTKNRENKDRFSIEEKMKYFFVVLKAGNHQEIGRSCPYGSHAEADAFINPPVVVAAAPKPQRKDDDYLACKMYDGHERSEKYPDFSTFEQDGEYFFAMLDADGDVKLRSERYQSAKGRDNGIKSVLKNREIEKRWSIEEKMGYYFSVLKAGNNQEIGRSCPYKEKPAMGMWWLAAPAMAMAAATIPPVVDVPVEKEKEDDYLACKEYENRKVNDKENNVALFKHKNGQFYFALYDKDGKVRLRSEGFKSAKKRDQELRGVLKYKDDKSMYSRIERKGYYIDVLKDKTGREVGRSCLKKDEPVVAAVPVAKKVIATAAVAAAATAATAATTSSAPKAAAAPAASGGGFKWWWLLPLLLIPLFFIWKSCNKTPDPVLPPPPPPVVTEVAPPPVTTETAPPPVAPAAPTCDCSALTHPVFDLPSGPAPKELTVLGRAPEFGNVHNLSTDEFYQKLNRAYKRSGTDKRFLDGIFKAMGYNGFSDATADMFSETTIQSGITANIGTGRNHKTVYRKLNLSGKDLKAFKIKAKNACDMHFMKTCGNHMFYCPN